MTIDEFKTELDRPIVVAYLSTPSCNVCKVLRPKVEQSISNFGGVHFLYVNTQESPEVAGQNMVFAVPTILLFVRGKEVNRWSRNLTVQELEESLRRVKAHLKEDKNEIL